MATTTRRGTRRRSPTITEPRTTAAPRAIYRRLLIAGLTPTEAGNVTAVAVGLPPVESGWSVREIERLRFLRYLVDEGRVGV